MSFSQKESFYYSTEIKEVASRPLLSPSDHSKIAIISTDETLF